MDSNFLISLGLIFSSSIAGSFHCGAMCGSFSCIASSRSKLNTSKIPTQIFYHLGRLITYSFLSLLFFFSASWISNLTNFFLLKYLILIVCLMILSFDLILDLPWIKKYLSSIKNWYSKFYNSSKYNKVFSFLFLKISNIKQNKNTVLSNFLLGLLTGMIPCGWLYIYVAMAGAQTSIIEVFLLIATFWLGTIPILVIVGKFGSALARSLFPRIKYLSRCLLIAATIIAIHMRSPFLTEPQKGGCHLCVSEKTSEK